MVVVCEMWELLYYMFELWPQTKKQASKDCVIYFVQNGEHDVELPHTSQKGLLLYTPIIDGYNFLSFG